MTKQIDIKELIPFMKKGWVAMNPNGIWVWFDNIPHKTLSMWMSTGYEIYIGRSFNIAPVSDWTKSLIKVENKDE